MDSKRMSKRDLVNMLYGKIQENAQINAAYTALARCSVRDLSNFLDALEETVYDSIKNATETESIIVPLFEGLTIEGVYTPQTVRTNNLTGKTITIASKIKPKATFTRTCIEKLSQSLK